MSSAILQADLSPSHRDVVVDGDKTSLHAIATALLQLQGTYGAPTLIRGKGPGAAVVKDTLLRLQQELGSQAPVPGEGAIDTLVLLDREVDSITPLMTQLTYEGLVDELLGITNGAVQFDVSGGQRQKFALNSSDQGSAPRGCARTTKGTKGPDRSIAELKQFTSQLKSLPHITRHINMAEAVSTQMRRKSLRSRVHVEQLLVDGRDVESCCEDIEEMMCSGIDLLTVLRLMCLVSLTQGGIPKRHCDGLRREVLHTYGHEHVLTLASLQTAGLLKRQEGARSNFASVRKAFRLLVEGLDDAVVPPLDAAFTYSGYCPLTARLAESALRPQGWSGLEDALRLLPGPHFEVKPTAFSEDPQDTEAPEPAPSAAAAPSGLGLLSRPGSGTGMGGGAGAFANLMRLGSSFREAPATGAPSKQHKTARRILCLLYVEGPSVVCPRFHSAGGLTVAEGAEARAFALSGQCRPGTSSPTARCFSSGGLTAAASQAEPVESTPEPSGRPGPADDDFVQQTESTSSGPLAIYRERRLSREYKKDPRQEATVLALQRLFEELHKHAKGRRKRSGLTMADSHMASQAPTPWWQGLGHLLRREQAADVPRQRTRGLYMYGGVGVGKTMLMDLLVEAAETEFKLRRIHFHDFMLEVHGALRTQSSHQDPLFFVADVLARKTKVFCLDEFFVTDVADATMLNRLFGHLWDCGTVLVATSNREPKKLYEGGLQRDLFMPFIARLESECIIHDMASVTDYRSCSHHHRGLFFFPPEFDNPNDELRRRFSQITQGQRLRPSRITVQMGRHLSVPLAGDHMCIFDFDDLCGRPVGAADFIAVAEEFHTLALENVPIFDAASRSEAYRFLTLVDVLYEHRIRLFCSSAGGPFDLFNNIMTVQDAKAREAKGENTENFVVDDNLGFSKDRLISRLTEMQSMEYLVAHAKLHAPELLPVLKEAQQNPDKFS
ncbi:hypothetical protein WJX84_004210 [Apatococcus fuscideae]|uniref:AFG1-like ATPase n=1 Tax=Apatococcus fuscideae TaxID=2026836 RepID=A0AAW1RV72_9CHLO